MFRSRRGMIIPINGDCLRYSFSIPLQSQKKVLFINKEIATLNVRIQHFILSCLFLLLAVAVSAQTTAMLFGRILSTDKSVVDFATVYLKGTNYGCTTNEKGLYHLKAPSGSYTLVVSAIGFETFEQKVEIAPAGRTKQNVILKPSVQELDEVVVVSTGVSRVKRSAFNAVAVDTKELHNSSKNLSEALQKLPGMKLRESGGVGSDMQLMLDGFSGKHVKVFIDGVPQEGAGTGFDLNNIPVNFAERIEVYKGVVPVGFGTDALGGVINIVTNKQKRNWFMDASYSYGSFNTHKSYVNFGQSFGNGLTYEINAYQNYSDNDYYIDNWVEEFNHDNNTSISDENNIQRVKRFNDTFHNEAVIGKIGVTGKSWADRLMFNLAYSHFYKEIQTGVYQEIVFGQKHRHGYSIVPSLEYSKSNLFTKGLDVTLSANYNHNITNNVDTAMYKYNWLGDRIPKTTAGEQNHQLSEQINTNWNTTFTAVYRIGNIHSLTFNNVFSAFRRTGRSLIEKNSVLEDYDEPTMNRKNIAGLSYRLMPSEKWNMSVFGKYYNAYSEGTVQISENSVGNDTRVSQSVSSFGYGAAGTYFLGKDLQFKLSYEKALRMPSTQELFGDGDLEAGKADLKPEKSDNINLSASYNKQIGKHGLYLEGGLIYRNTQDYIKRDLSTVGGTSYGSYTNHGRVETKGYNISVRYSFSNWFNAGGTFNNLDSRDKEEKRAASSGQNALTYGQRIPNIPYQYANLDANIYWHNLFAKGNTLSLGWDCFYQHEFPLYWESFGDSSTKIRVPKQLSHNISLGYSIKNGRYNISLECRNITDEKLYDNFSLQKAGRAFYGKFRVYFGK